jgi:hypothetical protein
MLMALDHQHLSGQHFSLSAGHALGPKIAGDFV